MEEVTIVIITGIVVNRCLVQLVQLVCLVPIGSRSHNSWGTLLIIIVVNLSRGLPLVDDILTAIAAKFVTSWLLLKHHHNCERINVIAIVDASVVVVVRMALGLGCSSDYCREGASNL